MITPVKASGGQCGDFTEAAYCVSVTVQNTGTMAGEEVVMMYLSNVGRAVSAGKRLGLLTGYMDYRIHKTW